MRMGELNKLRLVKRTFLRRDVYEVVLIQVDTPEGYFDLIHELIWEYELPFGE